MFTERPYRDGDNRAHPWDRHHEKSDGGQRNESSYAKNPPVAAFVQKRKDCDQKHPRRFAHEFKHTSVDSVNIIHIDKKVVERRLKTANTDTPHEDAREKRRPT
jgi:hypothetical protein